MNLQRPTLNFILFEEMWMNFTPSWEEEVEHALERATEILEKNFSLCEVSVVLTNDLAVHTLNKTFRHQDKPTNVLSFSSDEEGELGDIILAYETIIQEAIDLGISPLHHTLHLIIHGFLHLLGYDHEKEKEAHEMERMEILILKTLNINNPYEAL